MTKIQRSLHICSVIYDDITFLENMRCPNYGRTCHFLFQICFVYVLLGVWIHQKKYCQLKLWRYHDNNRWYKVNERHFTIIGCFIAWKLSHWNHKSTCSLELNLHIINTPVISTVSHSYSYLKTSIWFIILRYNNLQCS